MFLIVEIWGPINEEGCDYIQADSEMTGEDSEESRRVQGLGQLIRREF